MIQIKTQYPYIDNNGIERLDLIKTYAEDENGKRYYIKQVETGIEYAEAIDLYPRRYLYLSTDIEIVQE